MQHGLVLIVNPKSGKGAGRSVGAQTLALLRARGHEVVDASAASAGQAGQSAERAFEEGADTLVVVGGDGTSHLGINLCADRPIRLGMVPAGTGNDFARNLGIPVGDPVAAVRLIDAGLTQRVDVGRVTLESGEQRWFGGVLGAGFDAVVAARAERMRWPRGQLRYALAILRELPAFTPIPYAVELDGRRTETRAMLVAVANTASFGGGMRVCPDADWTDGRFDVLVLHELSIPAFLRVFPSVYSGRHVDHPAVEIIRARRIRLEANGIHAQADGEMVARLPVDVDLVPGALDVFVGGCGTDRIGASP